MNVIEWLEVNVAGFRDLPVADRDAILHFALLWCLFEATVLDANASPDAITRAVATWSNSGVLEHRAFAPAVEYFRDRYFMGGAPTEHFAGLRLSKNQEPTVVPVLRGADRTPAAEVKAALLIVYRLRNNLFHGIKWAYGIQGQRPNFEVAKACSRALHLTPNYSVTYLKR